MKFKATDFDLIEIKYEVSILKEQLETISNEFQKHKKKSKNATDKEIEEADFDPDDPSHEAEFWYLVDEHKHLVEDVLPRILINPFIVSLWTLYETAITDLADLIKEKESQDLSWFDVDGPHLTAKIQKYFEEELDFSISFTPKLLKSLKTIVKFRNGIAHGNSRLSSLEESFAQKLREREIDGTDISRTGDYFVIYPNFAQWSFNHIKDHLNEIMDEYERKYS